MKTPKTLEEIRDEAIAELKRYPTINKATEILKFKEGFDKALSALEGEVEFDRGRFDKYIKLLPVNVKEYDRLYAVATWMHDQCKAQVGLAKMQIQNLNHRLSLAEESVQREIKHRDEAWEKVERLEKELAEARAMIKHALHLGHLGDGSTKGWAEDILKEHGNGG